MMFASRAIKYFSFAIVMMLCACASVEDASKRPVNLDRLAQVKEAEIEPITRLALVATPDSLPVREESRGVYDSVPPQDIEVAAGDEGVGHVNVN